jgi:hypothetical protein
VYDDQKALFSTAICRFCPHFISTTMVEIGNPLNQWCSLLGKNQKSTWLVTFSFQMRTPPIKWISILCHGCWDKMGTKSTFYVWDVQAFKTYVVSSGLIPQMVSRITRSQVKN